MCVNTPCAANPAKYGELLSHDGLEAQVLKLGNVLWRGSRMDTPPLSQQLLFNELSRQSVIPEILDSKQCGQWWWVATPYLRDRLDPLQLDTWLVLARKLAQWHKVSDSLEVSKGNGYPKWAEGLAVRGAVGAQGFCHTDLHDENAMKLNGKAYILDGWAPLYGPFGVDIGVLAVGAVTELRDWSAWDSVLRVYHDAGGIGDTSQLNIADVFRLVTNYGPGRYAERVMHMLEGKL